MTLIQAVLYLYRNVFINVQSLLIRIKVIDYYTISGCLKGNSFVPAHSKTKTKGANAVAAAEKTLKRLIWKCALVSAHTEHRC